MAQDINLNLQDKIFFVGVALSSGVNYDSAIAVLDKNKNIISLDKFYILEDFTLFMKNYMSKKDTVFCVSIPSDNTILDGKWRIHAKNFKMVSQDFSINKNNWTNRNSNRGADILSQYKNEGASIFRYDISELRFAYNISSFYPMRTSLDCKSFHNTLKMKYGFKELPDNMLPASNMEALLGAMFAYDIANGAKIQRAFEFQGIDVLFKTV